MHQYNGSWAMGSSSSRSIQNALILNLIIFLTGAIVHNIAIMDFSYADLLSSIIGTSTLAGMQSYFALSNSSAVITGMLVVFAYAAVYSIAKPFVGRIKKRSHELVIKV